MRIRRSEASKKFQKCKKHHSKKKGLGKNKCIKIYDSLRFYADRAIKQRTLRNKKRVDCSEKKLKYENWLRNVQFIMKKLRIKFLKNREKERIVLIKRYQALELKYKYEIDSRERKLTKQIETIRKDCNKKVKTENQRALKITLDIEKKI